MAGMVSTKVAFVPFDPKFSHNVTKSKQRLEIAKKVLPVRLNTHKATRLQQHSCSISPLLRA